MTDRPDPNDRKQVVRVMCLFKSSEEDAKMYLSTAQTHYDLGVKAGKAQAQRFLRLALGLEKPTHSEAAYWNNPVPLKGD